LIEGCNDLLISSKLFPLIDLFNQILTKLDAKYTNTDSNTDSKTYKKS
jgi:hypothetical protein